MIISLWSLLTFLNQVPEALKMYMPEQYREVIPFVNKAPIEEEEAKKAAKKQKGGKAKDAKEAK